MYQGSRGGGGGELKHERQVYRRDSLCLGDTKEFDVPYLLSSVALWCYAMQGLPIDLRERLHSHKSPRLHSDDSRWRCGIAILREV